jgi:WD40 repeat protein
MKAHLSRTALLAGLLLGVVVPAQGAGPAGKDRYGDPLPEGALARLGPARFRLPLWQGRSACLSPDGKLLAATDRDYVRLLEVATGKVVRHFPGNPVDRSLLFSPDGKYLVSTGVGGGVRFADATSGRQTQYISPGYSNFTSVQFSGDGKVVALCPRTYGQQKKAVVRLFAVADGKEIVALETLGSANAAALSGDGKVVATWGGRTIRLWDGVTGKELRPVGGELRSVACAALSPDGKVLAGAGRGTEVQLWDVPTGRPLRTFPGRPDNVRQLTFSPDGKLLVGVGGTGRVQVWDVGTGRRLDRGDGPPCPFSSLAFPPGKVLACGVQGQALVVWDALGGRALSPVGGHDNDVTAVAFAPGGKTLYSAESASKVLEWDAATGKELREVKEGRKPAGQRRRPPMTEVGPVRFSPDGRHLAVASHFGKVAFLRELAHGQEVFSFRMRADGITQPALAFSPDGSVLAVGDGAAGLSLWEVRSGAGLPRLYGQTALAVCAAFSPDGKRVAVGTLTDPRRVNAPVEVRAWDLATRKEAPGFAAGPFQRQAATSLVFSPDGKVLALAEQSGTVYLLEGGTGRLVHQLKAPTLVNALAFSPDGRTVAAGGWRQRPPGAESHIVFWETSTGQQRRALRSDEAPVQALAYSPDGKVLAAGNRDTTVLLWDADGRPPSGDRPAKLSAEALDRLWSDLAGDAAKAYGAIVRLSAAPGDAVPFLRKHLRPAKAAALDEKAIAALVARLDAEQFEDRQKAERELEALGREAAPALRKALEGSPPAELKRRARALLGKAERPGLAPELVRLLRALEVLERAGTPEAKALLRDLAGGQPGAVLTEDAKASLQRLAKRPPATP